MTEMKIRILKKCFNELTNRKFRCLHMKNLYQCMKNKGLKLTINEFHDLLLELWRENYIYLSKGSSIRPYTKRYGLLLSGCYYAYVSLNPNIEV